MPGRCWAAGASCLFGAASGLTGVAIEGGGALDPEPFLSLLQVLAKPLRRIEVGPANITTNISEEIATLASLRHELEQLERKSVEAASADVSASPTGNASGHSSRSNGSSRVALASYPDHPARTCSFTEPRSASRLPAGRMRSRVGASTEECLAWCLGDAKCLSVVFEPGTGVCHALPETYGNQSFLMITADAQAVVVDKYCPQQCGFSMPRNGRSPKQVLKHIRARSFTTCKQRCAGDRRCLSVVYRKSKRDCWLKKQAYDQNLQFSTDDAMCSNKICRRACTFPAPQLLSEVGGLVGMPRSQAASSLDECQGACAASSSCGSVVYDSASPACFVVEEGRPRLVGASDLVVSQKRAASRCSCSAVPAGKCMTGCDPHGSYTRSESGVSINQCECNYEGTDCEAEADAWACDARPCVFTANGASATVASNEEDDPFGPPSRIGAAPIEADADDRREFEAPGEVSFSNFHVAISQRASNAGVPRRKKAGRRGGKTGDTLDEASRAAAKIAADAGHVNDALEAAAEIAVIPDEGAHPSGTAASPATAVSLQAMAGHTDDDRERLRHELPRVLLGGRAYSAKDSSQEMPAMNLTLEAGQSFSVAFTASWYSLQSSSRALAIFDDGVEGVRLRISNAGSTSTLALVVHRGDREATLKVPEAITVGVTSRFLCIIAGDDAGGQMQVYRDGKRIGLLHRGLSLGALQHGRLYLAGGPTQMERNKKPFEGWLSDICTWKRQASWQDAAECTERGDRK